MKIIILILFIQILSISAYSADDLIIKKTGSHICELSGEKNKFRLAVYGFTDEKDQETPYTKKCTTRIITILLNCGKIKIIDPTKVQKVMEEQEKGMSGIVDDKTAPETGKLLGADAILFGQVDNKTIQIRLIDATTGEIIGAKVEEADGKTPRVQEEKFNDEKSKKGFREEQHRKQLQYLINNRPGVFIFMTSTEEELDKFKSAYPKRFEKIQTNLDNAPRDKKEKFNMSRKLYLELRTGNKNFNDKILSDHRRIMKNLKQQKENR